MLHTRSRFERNPLFHFHPMQTTYALIGALVLLGAAAWMMLAMR